LRCTASYKNIYLRSKEVLLNIIMMRFKIFHDDHTYHYIVDTKTDVIIGKIKNAKEAARICQKLNRADGDHKLSSKTH